MIMWFTLENKEGAIVALQWFVCCPLSPLTLKTSKREICRIGSTVNSNDRFLENSPIRVTQKSGIWIGALSSCHFFLLPSAISGCLALRATLNDTAFIGEHTGSGEVLCEGWKTVFTYKICRFGPYQLWFWWAGWRIFKVRRALRYGGKNRLSISCFNYCATWKSCSFLCHFCRFSYLQNRNISTW